MKVETMVKQIEGTRFQSDLGNVFSFDGNPMSRAYYNLVVTIRDVSLFSKGIKPHRFWRLKDVKAYFGVKGGTDKVLKQLESYRDLMLGLAEKNKEEGQ